MSCPFCNVILTPENTRKSNSGTMYCKDCITPRFNCVACNIDLNKMQDYECVCGAHVCEQCAYGRKHACEQSDVIRRKWTK